MNTKKEISLNLNTHFTKRMYFCVDSAKFDVSKMEYFNKDEKIIFNFSLISQKCLFDNNLNIYQNQGTFRGAISKCKSPPPIS